MGINGVRTSFCRPSTETMICYPLCVGVRHSCTQRRSGLHEDASVSGWQRFDAQVQPRRSEDQERKGPAYSRHLLGTGRRGCGEAWGSSSGKVKGGRLKGTFLVVL